MANEKKTTKRELKLARKAEAQQVKLLAERQTKQRRIALVAVPVATLAIALGLYQFPSARSAAGLTLLGGFLVWLAVALGTMGGMVSSRGRGDASAIDYGKRR